MNRISKHYLSEHSGDKSQCGAATTDAERETMRLEKELAVSRACCRDLLESMRRIATAHAAEQDYNSNVVFGLLLAVLAAFGGGWLLGWWLR